jgi:hypothetical protein
MSSLAMSVLNPTVIAPYKGQHVPYAHIIQNKENNNIYIYEFYCIIMSQEGKFNIILTVHLRIILVGNQLNAQFLL